MANPVTGGQAVLKRIADQKKGKADEKPAAAKKAAGKKATAAKPAKKK